MPYIEFSMDFTKNHNGHNNLNLAYVNEIDNERSLYLQPVVIPKEPTLEELLKHITGRDDLHDVCTINLKVISSMISLSRLPIFMPKLQVLNLNGSVLNSLRDLGCGLHHLTTLNISNCGLNSLDGTSCLPSLQILLADHNRIEIINPLRNLTFLEKLSLKYNRITRIENLSFLALCPLLKNLNLKGNPVVNKLTYREEMKRNIVSLEMLDDVDVNNILYIYSSTEPVLSNSTEDNDSNHFLNPKELSNSLEDIRKFSNNYKELNRSRSMENFTIISQKSIISEETPNVTIRQTKELNRQVITDLTHLKRFQTINDPISGSIVGVARRKRKTLSWKNSKNWNSSFPLNSKSFQEKIFYEPQKMIDLELGVVGMMSDHLLSSRNSQTSSDDQKFKTNFNLQGKKDY